MKTSMIRGATEGHAALTTAREIVGDELIKSGRAKIMTIDTTVCK